ncbi:hypothetical protein DKX38_011444 [Salix brachista]|uniref:Uncharacterized protein n=1 Tax=Salix brachista TaxID=2182728 RepID=A0A5N5LZD4_9ROSI|nr:hypothetical protein DKX38_011444 [Salix brachista]
MAATDPHRQLLTLIREFASEKSQGERRMIGLKKRIQELGCEVDVANAEMEEMKCIKETTEQELKGNELQLALMKLLFKPWRDEFICQMFDLNAKIRLVSLTWTYVALTGNLFIP